MPISIEERILARQRYFSAVRDFTKPPVYDPSVEPWFVPANAVKYSAVVRELGHKLADFEGRRLAMLRDAAREHRALVRQMRGVLVNPQAMQKAVTVYLRLSKPDILDATGLSYLALLDDDGIDW